MTETIQLSDFPILFTPAAITAAINARDSDPENPNAFVRVGVRGGGCSGYRQTLDFDFVIDDEEDIVQDFEAEDGRTIRVAVDCASADYLRGITIDFVREGIRSGFKFMGGSKVSKRCGCGSSFLVD